MSGFTRQKSTREDIFNMSGIIQSRLESDFYKITMGQLAFFQFPNANVKYRFIDRNRIKFPSGFAEGIMEETRRYAELKGERSQFAWLAAKSPFLKPNYLEWLETYKIDPREVYFEQDDEGHLSGEIKGKWYRAIHWEVVLMAIISEMFFRNCVKDPLWKNRLINKASNLSKHGVSWLDFGTRRRFSFEVQSTVVEEHKKFEGFRGTSNPYLAYLNDLAPQGTYAHEFVQFMQAVYGVRSCNQMAMKHWVDEFGGQLGTMLPDTVTSEYFLKVLDVKYAKLFDGWRQDSGDPIAEGEKFLYAYRRLGINPKLKGMVPSDGLNDESLIKIADYFKDKYGWITGGIGTAVSNDCGHVPLNMVVKMWEADVGHGWWPVVKLSNSHGKHTGDSKWISHVKTELGIAEEM